MAKDAKQGPEKGMVNVVMTGATAGFGLFTAGKILDAGHRLIIGARNPDAIPAEIIGRTSVERLDLNSLTQVRAFSNAVSGSKIDVLILNAGIQLSKPTRSEDGFEQTFAVNHLSHYLLLRLLADSIAREGRVILTGSGTHDPAEKTPITPPIHAIAEYLAYPERDPRQETRILQSVFRAYTSSKLCNIMTAREFSKRYPSLSVMSFDPAYVPHTSLGRNNPKLIAKAVSFILPHIMKRDRSSTIARSGQFLADLALEQKYAASRGNYWAVRGSQMMEVAPSALARDAVASAKLWDDSARLAGIVI